jgi:hypothetical protein
MDTPFPFGFPGPTAFYLTLYVVTLVIHVAFMNYVLAGTAWVAWDALSRRRPDMPEPVAVLRDWMPLMLSGAITAGIAPLLFVQILYKPQFYTANLLLSHRWMSILPVLIVGFYALYLLKTGWLKRRGRLLNAVVGVVPFLCVAFVGYSWTENHLLSLRDTELWARFYAAGSLVYSDPVLVPRLLVWAFGSLPTLAVLLGWQLGYRRGYRPGPEGDRAPRDLSALAWAGIGASTLAAAAYAALAPAGSLAAAGPLAWPYLAAAGLGLAVQAFAWLMMWRSRGFLSGVLALASAGWLLTVLGMTVCREAVRLCALGSDRLEQLYPQHARAAQVGGLGWFLFFFALNAALIGLCVVLVRRGRVEPGAAGGPS